MDIFFLLGTPLQSTLNNMDLLLNCNIFNVSLACAG